MRILILLLAAVIVALGAGAFLYTRSGPEPAPQVAAPVVEEPKAPELVEVFTPSTPIAAGTIMTESVLRTFEMDPDKVSDEMIVVDEEGREFLIGGVARHSLAEGVPIARTSIIHPGDRGFLAAVLPKGMRAISIEITEVAGLSGLVLPGDHVDLILTYTVTAEQGDHERDIHASRDADPQYPRARA